MPPRSGALEKKHYAICSRCWHVERHLDKDEVFRDAVCPVCGHDGKNPLRRKHHYIVPSFGFTTDLLVQGEDLAFDRPIRIPASRVLFVPQKDADDPTQVSLGGRAGLWVEVRTTVNADFFVFNDGDDPSGKGFSLCRYCGRLLEPSLKGKTEHLTPLGKPCQGTASPVHLGHDFRGCAARLTFGGTGHTYDDQSFWMSLLYALLGGMSDALGIEPQDINGVIRPIRLPDGDITQEIVLFDDVPGGAGHVQRLEDQEELIAVLEAALARVVECGGCDNSASCYRCLRSYRNQFCHDLLVRQGAADYLEKLWGSVAHDPESDRLYTLSDKASALRSALRESRRAALVVDGLTIGGPDEGGPWYILLQEVAARHKALTLAVRTEPVLVDGSFSSRLPLLAVQQAGADPPPRPGGCTFTTLCFAGGWVRRPHGRFPLGQPLKDDCVRFRDSPTRSLVQPQLASTGRSRGGDAGLARAIHDAAADPGYRPGRLSDLRDPQGCESRLRRSLPSGLTCPNRESGPPGPLPRHRAPA